LQQSQQIQKLYNIWWKEKNEKDKACFTKTRTEATALSVENVGGVFVVLVGGVALGMLLACVEFMWKAKKNARVDKVHFNILNR